MTNIASVHSFFHVALLIFNVLYKKIKEGLGRKNWVNYDLNHIEAETCQHEYL